MKPQPKHKRWQSKKWRDAAKDQPCTMRLPCCNNNPETTVFAHASGSGMGMKADDYNGADMCSSCHDAYDGRIRCIHTSGSVISRSSINACFYPARMQTIINRLERGIVK